MPAGTQQPRESQRYTVKLVPKTFTAIPPEARYLWHVISITQLNKLATFLDGGLWFARLDQFGKSTREGELPHLDRIGLYAMLVPESIEVFKQNLKKWHKISKDSQVKRVIKEYEKAAAKTYASCWHQSDSDPDWNGLGSKGAEGNAIAIRTTSDILRDALKPILTNDGPGHFSSVKYINHDKASIPFPGSYGQTLYASFTISECFKQQDEARVLIHLLSPNVGKLCSGCGPYGQPVRSAPTAKLVGGQDRGRAIVVAVDPEKLIEEIVIGPAVTEADGNQISKLLDRHQLKHKLRP